MVHLTNTLRSATFLLGTAMLMLFFFCAPMHAQTPTFKSTSSYRIDNPNYSSQQLDPTTIGHQTYRSTIYTPFGSGTPSSNNPSGNSGSGGSGDPDDDVGIPGWADTPSEPLPVGDTAPLFLFAAAMIAINWIRQRKQQRLTTQTQSTINNNDTTQHMTTRKQTYQSLCQKLFLLLAFVCVAGQVSAEKKTIYFRPSTVAIENGYAGSWGLSEAKTAYHVSWAKRIALARFLVLEKKSDGTYAEYSDYKLAANILPTATNLTTNYSRFIPTELDATSSFAIYRIENQYNKVETGIKGSYCNCIPNNEWWKSNGTANKGTMLISMSDLGDCNMVAIREGYWATGREDKWKGYYFGYYLEEDAHIYFDNKNDWTAPTFLRSKDIYAYTHDLTKISGTNLWYCKLAKPTKNDKGRDDPESGIAYTQYAFISNRTTKTTDQTTFKTDIAVGVEDPYLWKRFPHNTDNDTDLARGNRNKHNFDNLKEGKNYTETITKDKLSGKTNLYIPGAEDGAKVDKHTLGSWQDLNHTHTVTVEEGGKLNYGTTWLTGESSSASDTWANKTGTFTFQAAYTASVTLRAIPDNGYVFLGFYDAEKNEMLSRGVQEPYDIYPITHRYTYDAPNSAQKIIAKFAKGSSARKFSVRTMIYDGSLTASLAGGTFTMTHSGGITYTHAKIGYHDMYVSNAPVTFEATPNSGYEFIGWFNVDKEKRYPDKSWTIDNPMDTEKYKEGITAIFASSETYAKKQNINIEGSGTVEANYIFYNDGTNKTTTFDKNSSFVAWAGSEVTLTATAKDGYTFGGWYKGLQLLSPNSSYSYNATEAKNITARFRNDDVKHIAYRVQTCENGDNFYDDNTHCDATGGTLRMTATDGQSLIISSANSNDKFYQHIYHQKDAIVTCEAESEPNYVFIGWWNNKNGQFLSNPWISNVADMDQYVTARFAHVNNIKTQTIKIQGSGNVAIDYYLTDASQRSETFSAHTVVNAWKDSQVTLTANPLAGYEFVGWYDAEDNPIIDGVSGNKLTYTADDAKTITAKFKSAVNKLTVSVLNYDTKYNEFREYEYEYNTITLKDQNGTQLATSYSSFSCEFKDATNVTLAATPENGEDGYDFVGWYMNGKEVLKGDNDIYTLETDISTTLTLKNVSGTVSVSAHFAPKKCYHVQLHAPMGGTYSVKYARAELFDQPGMYYVVQSEYANIIDIYVPYNAKIAVINPLPIHGYQYLGFRVHQGTNNNDGTWTIDKSDPGNLPQVISNFVRTEEQVVYLDVSNKDKDSYWKDVTTFSCNMRNPANPGINSRKVFEKVEGFEYLYKTTIDANTYDYINIVDEYNTSTITTGRLAIPSTRYNCFKLNAYQSSTGEWVDAWTTLPTQTGDYRLIYREQTVVSKNEIHIDYEFNEGDRIKNINFDNQTAKTQTDIVSLHIYNKVSDGINGVNNPEVILQQWDGREWADVERYMVFGPLRSNNTSVIKMPNRKNTTGEKISVDQGIGNIIAEADGDDQACGVWNFVIQQTKDNAGKVTAKLLVNQTHRYEGDYYIRTTNADGQYNNYTHPGNVMKLSEYAAAHSDYSHYFIRYVDINEDGTPTSQAGKHNQVKFTVATAYTEFLCKELMINNNRFSEDEYENDIFVINDNNNPKLPADATVRFGWDSVTNRLTRAYIANTTIKNNEYLVVEGSNIGSPSGEATYFNDNSNYLYSIDLNATKNATAKVKAKMNGKYQYFMGTNAAGETLISGNGANTYPIRLLYDFKDDRFTTIYRPKAALSGTVNLETPVMIEREHNEAPTQIKFNSGAKIQTSGTFDQPAYAVMTFLESVLADASKTHHEKMFYWISFPFDVRISDVFGLGEYGKYWIMEEYDGAQRAQSGLAKSNWKYITKKSAVLSKNVGYVLCLNYSQILQDQLFKSYGSQDENLTGGKLSLYFPSNGVINPADITGGQQRTVPLARYDNTTTGSNTAWNHHNWHIIGVPSFADPTLTNVQTNAPFVYEYWHPSDAYAAKAYNEVEFHAMHAYMVQYFGDITWTSVVNTGGSVSKLAAKTDEQADKNIMLRLELQQAGSTLDKTYVQLRNDKGTKGFDMSLDLTKIINAGANIYSIVDNHEMAGNAIPKDETVLPLGVVITAAGEYTFAMPNGTEGMIVELIDYEQGTSTNLLMSDYTITLDKGTFNQRFALRLKPDKVATSVDNIGNGANGDEVKKLLIDGVLYLQQGTNTYDAQGHAIR